MSFKCKFHTQYHLNGSDIPIKQLQKDLGVLISSDLTWTSYISYITAKAYKILGLLRWTFGSSHNPMATKKLYLTLVRSQVSCSPVWRPHLSKDILLIEQVQRRSTKFILNDYHSSSFDRLVKLQILPLMYTLELLDIVFCLKSLKSPSTHFNIHDYITFATGPIWSSTFNKLEHNYKLALNNVTRHSYFYRLTRLWNSVPPIDYTLSVSTNKQIIYKHLWNNFIHHFNPDNPCTFSYLCPCNTCAYITPVILHK